MKIKNKMVLSIGSILLIVLSLGFVYIYQSTEAQSQQLYYKQAKSINNDFKIVRTVISGYGGVFASEDKGAEVNPFLVNRLGMGKAQLEAANGNKYALLNGFSFITEMSKVSQGNPELHSFDFRIPSLTPESPVNLADEDEAEVIRQFQEGKLKETYGIEKNGNGEPVFRYTSAMVTQEACIKCHVDDKAGDINAVFNVYLPIAEEEAAKKATMRNLFLMFMGATAVVLGVVYSVSNTMASPINQLAEAADKISKGETDVSIDIKRDDEIGELAESFNRMVASLKIMMMDDEDE